MLGAPWRRGRTLAYHIELLGADSSTLHNEAHEQQRETLRSLSVVNSAMQQKHAKTIVACSRVMAKYPARISDLEEKIRCGAGAQASVVYVEGFGVCLVSALTPTARSRSTS